MKKTIWTMTLLFLMAGLLAAQTPDEEYLKAMQMSDSCQKVQALDAYITNYAGKGGQYDNYAYAYYCLEPCATKNAQKAIGYGEKALTMGGIDENTKVRIIATIPSLYASLGQMDKAKAAAQRLIDLGKASSNAKTKAQLQATGYVLIGQFAEKSNDYGAAAKAYITAYSILKDPGISKLLNNLASSLYKSGRYAEAEQVFQQFYDADKGPESAALLGQTLYKEGKLDEALAVFKQAFAEKKTGPLAINIAIILNQEVKTNPALRNEAIQAFIEAAVLNPSQSKMYLQAAKNLYISESPDLAAINAKIEEHNKAYEQLTNTYNDKFGGKSVDDLTPHDKDVMQKLKAAIASEQDAITQLQGQLKDVLDKFNQLVAQVRSKLGR
jgi:tetratricopeptide (TPR) repeat protein